MYEPRGPVTSPALHSDRQEASSCIPTRFFTGRPCRAGHLAERFVTNGQCVVCNAQKARNRERQKSRDDPAYRLFRNVHRRAGQALGGSASPSASVGATMQTLRHYIEAQFRPGMSWENYRQWEVDHILPLSGATSFDDLVSRCHYTNLQPLWRRQNRMKGGA